MDYYLLDVFTKEKFGGNQLAVFPDAKKIDGKAMQSIANELKLAESAFVTETLSPSKFKMRIFTPDCEMPTAGHPTIGTAFVVAKHLIPTPDDGQTEIVFEQKVGDIRVRVDIQNGSPTFATMQQPLPNFGEVFSQERASFCKLLNIEDSDLLDLPIQRISCGNYTTIVPVKNISTLKRIKFRLDVWEDLKNRIKGLLYVFAPQSEAGGQVHGRMFAPEQGVLEDAATGSANGPLGCYIAHYGVLQDKGSVRFVSEQGFEMGRSSYLHVDVTMTKGDVSKVEVGGSAIFVGKGTLFE